MSPKAKAILRLKPWLRENSTLPNQRERKGTRWVRCGRQGVVEMAVKIDESLKTARGQALFGLNRCDGCTRMFWFGRGASFGPSSVDGQQTADSRQQTAEASLTGHVRGASLPVRISIGARLQRVEAWRWSTILCNRLT